MKIALVFKMRYMLKAEIKMKKNASEPRKILMFCL
jgi:hypothetical protein